MQKIPSASLCLITNTFLTITGERRASVQLDGNDIVEILKTNIINASKIPIFISLTKRLTTSCEYGIFTRNKGEKMMLLRANQYCTSHNLFTHPLCTSTCITQETTYTLQKIGERFMRNRIPSKFFPMSDQNMRRRQFLMDSQQNG